MLCQSHELKAQPGSLRWKEWIPLASQQLRLRNLIRIIAFNVNPGDNHVQGCNSHELARHQRLKESKIEQVKSSYYYTLHLTTMSAPFYTSEKLESENPKWNEIEMACLTSQVNAAVNGVVIRLWLHQPKEQDQVITVWGVYFSGLVYLGPKLHTDPASLHSNSIVFQMQGGYFTAAQCLKESPAKSRTTNISLNQSDVKPSYNVNSLLRLHTKQQAIKKHVLAALDLREKISVGGLTPKSNENSVLRRLLNESRPKAPKRQELLKARQQVELVMVRVEMLTREKARKQADLQQREKIKLDLQESNMDRGLDLMSRYQNLHKDIERLREWKKSYVDSREIYLHTNAQLTFRRKQLISELSLIYPIVQMSDKFSICGVCLPNSDVFTAGSGSEEVSLSVALGFVAHLVQMVSVFLQVPLRYPVIHFSSRSKIIDHVADKIPDSDREFPLFSRGKDKLQFNYGVYLLNKNVAQLRWYCGIPTRDLPATLPNISVMLLHRLGTNGLDLCHRSMSGSSLDLRSSSQNISPVGSLQQAIFRRHTPAGMGRHSERGHRISKSMGSSELKFPLKIVELDVQSAQEMSVADVVDIGNSSSMANNLSCSLDKGLDEYEGIKKTEVTARPILGVATQKQMFASQGLVGSEPILTPDMHEKLGVYDVREVHILKDEAQKRFLQSWQAGGGLGQICSDDEFDSPHRPGAKLGNGQKTVDKPYVIENNRTPTDGRCRTELINVLTHINTSPISANKVEVGFEDTSEQKCDIQLEKSTVCDKSIPELLSIQTVLPTSSCHIVHSHESFDSAVNDDTVEATVGLHKTHVSDEQCTDCASVENESLISVTNGETKDEGEVALHDSDVSSPLASKHTPSESHSQLTGQSVVDGFSEMFVEDNLFANVTSRTEALANRKTSFNRVRSRHSSSLDDGPS